MLVACAKATNPEDAWNNFMVSAVTDVGYLVNLNNA